MKRDDITKQFPEATAEQINALLDINSADIGKAKKSAETTEEDLKAKIAELEQAKTTIKELESNKGKADELQKIIDDYKAKEEQRKQEAERANARKLVEDRFNAVLKDRKFANDYTRAGVLGDFEKAIADQNNVGKSDEQIFNSLVSDDKGVKAGIFQSEHKVKMGGTGKTLNTDAEKLAELYKNNPYYKG